MGIVNSKRITESTKPTASYPPISRGTSLNQIRAQLDISHHAIPSSLPPSCPILRSESATSSDVVPPLPSGGSPNSIRESTLTCVLDRASDVQPLPLDLEAFLRDSINLDIMSGKSLSQWTVSTSGRHGTKMQPYTRFPLRVVQRYFRSCPFVHGNDQLTGQGEAEVRAGPTGYLLFRSPREW